MSIKVKTLTDFLLARAAELDQGYLHTDDCPELRDADSCDCGGHDRARAYAAALRRIAELHSDDGTGDKDKGWWPGKCKTCSYESRTEMRGGGWETYEVKEDWPCDTLRALALPHAWHPDYREEWRPGRGSS